MRKYKNMNKLKLAVFASHSGSNLQAIIDNIKNGYLNAEIVAVISNNSNAYALERARLAKIDTFHISSKTHPNETDYLNAILNILDSKKVDLIILAGYMKPIPVEIINKYYNRILNIHPALLPKFGGSGMYGMNVHKAVIESKEKTSGATVHIVDEKYDNGKILYQESVNVDENDTPETLADKVLQIEHKIYSKVIKLISEGKITL